MKHISSHIDWRLVTPVIFLIIISSTVLFSINPEYFRNQLFALGISFFIFFLFSQISYLDFRHFSLFLYIISLALLVIVLIIGFESKGAVRWVEIFGISLQASEVAKPLLSLAFAGIIANHSNRDIKTYLLVFVSLIPVFILIYLQPDLGNALLFLGVAVITLLVYGLPLRWFILSIIPVFAMSPFLWNLLHDYQKLRIVTFFYPAQDPGGSSYNLIQAIIAVGSGGAFGKGFSEGTQSRLKFLPENHTDFIFASLAEKLGFLGSIIVVILFIFLLIRIYTIFRKTQDNFAKIFITCSFLFLLFQFFINIGMNLGVVPIVGITLPFVSYGGSSLFANFITLGIASSISVRNDKREVLEIR